MIISYLIFYLIQAVFLTALVLLRTWQALGIKSTVSNALTTSVQALPKLFILYIIFVVPWIFFHLLSDTDLVRESILVQILFYLVAWAGGALTTWACFAFAVPLMLIKGYSVIMAAIEGITAAVSYWWQLLILTFAMVLIMSLSLLTLGILSLWTIPMSFNIYGILFREVFMPKATE